MINEHLQINDTIVAIATPLTPAGIGVIRISGSNALNIANKIFVNKKKEPKIIIESHKVVYGFIYDKSNDELVDEILLIYMKAPHSYTAEDVIEIQSHGNQIILKNILDVVIKNGARIAEPGEFTKRAYLNGRIDLSKAEAVSDLIMSKNEYAKKASFSELNGNLSNKIDFLRKQILESIAFIEACIDDPEHLSIEGYVNKLEKEINNANKEIKKIIDNYSNGKIIKEGINTVILGKPNVGKSSLLNCLLNEDRAIVTNIEGTTRDIIKEQINLDGITLNIIDTAGIRNNNEIEEVEKLGILKSKNAAENADLLIIMLDPTRDIDENDNNILYYILKKKCILIINKSDAKNKKFDKNILKKYLNDFFKSSIEDITILNLSTITKEGIYELKSSIKNMFIKNELNFNDEIFISNERQLNLLKKAYESLSAVLISIKDNLPEDFLTIDLNDAYIYLSQILGEEIDDDIANEIFSKFCMGK